MWQCNVKAEYIMRSMINSSLVILMFTSGCNSSQGNSTLEQINNELSSGELPDEGTFDVGITQEDIQFTSEEAIEIAVKGLDAEVYVATDVVGGPQEYHGEWIYSYQVIIMSADHTLLRFVHAKTGELLHDIEQRHEFETSCSDDYDSGEIMPVSYIDYCPSWPLWFEVDYFYSQNDPSWDDNTLGWGPDTIGESGCLLTAYAMAYREMGISSKNPESLNSYAKRKGRFSSGVMLDGVNLTKDLGGRHKIITHDQIWSEIARGRPVVAYGCEDWWSGVYAHAMVLYGHDGSRYWGKDPYYDWTDQDQPMHMSSGCTSVGNYRVAY